MPTIIINNPGIVDGPSNPHIIQFDPSLDDIDSRIDKIEKSHNFKVHNKYYHAMKGFSANLTPNQISKLFQDKDIIDIEKDSVMSIMLHSVEESEKKSGEKKSGEKKGEEKEEGGDVKSEAIQWNQTLTNTVPQLADDFSLVNVFVLDTGIKPSHIEFEPGQVKLAYNAISGTTNAADDNNHGTGVASVIGGKTIGSALKTTLHAVKVLDRNGSGYTSTIIKGMDWVIANRPTGPVVMNLSLGGTFSSSLNSAVQRCITAGIHVVVAAGNSGVDASTQSPSSALPAITVAAHDSNKIRPSWSNYGPVVDVFAPGASVLAAWNVSTSNSGYALLSGTSFSCPVVAAVIARYLKSVPNASPTDSANYLSIADKLGEIVSPGTGSPNKRVYWDPTKIGGGTC